MCGSTASTTLWFQAVTDQPTPAIDWALLRESACNLAEAMWTYYHALIAIQFTEEQAMLLTLGYQTHLVSQPPEVEPVRKRWFAR